MTAAATAETGSSAENSVRTSACERTTNSRNGDRTKNVRRASTGLCVLAQQVDATEDPSHDDRDAHDDEPRERLQHPSSLEPSGRYDFAVRVYAARRAGAAVVVGIALAALCGCASDEAGFGLPVLDADDAQAAIASGAAEQASLAGTLRVESNGCFTWSDASGAEDLDGAWIVWPAEARQDGDAVVLGSGARVGENDDIDVVGAAVELDDLPDGANHDSYFGSFGGFCDAGEHGVLVLTEVVGG